ncbi:hypothetical protein F9B85_08820 [Heliorestis acidaminivorans]|uniref:Uncharacterized protein n=1 Tax=Heliorestis acidaminivorans TaxID=553427 RepID=A0A6I0F1H8_9FIRM|nr:hypothetical protein [Heliorestis acidaminivorans]KAB2952261.1 hypothetical protein F9B85_08820 [Heliorestis acidaminivorans]
MNKTLWKWLLDMMAHEELVSLARAMQVKVPGFRQIVMDQRFTMLRPRLIQTILSSRSFIKLQEAMDKHMQLQAHFLACREKETSELLEIIQLGSNPATVLSVLASSSEQSHQEKAEALFTQLQESGQLQSYENHVQENRKSEAEQRKVIESTDQLQKQYQEMEKKIQKTEEKIAKLNQQFEKQKNDFDNEKSLWQHERQSLLQKIKEKDRRIKDKEEEIGRLAELCDTLQKTLQNSPTWNITSPAEAEVASTEIIEKKTLAEEKVSEKNNLKKQQIALVGKLPHNINRLHNLNRYTIQNITTGDIARAFEESLFAKSDQVWVLNYDIPLVIKRKLRREVKIEKYLEFNSFAELQRYLKQGESAI